jgi:tRNA G37 N-methylase TrmD
MLALNVRRGNVLAILRPCYNLRERAENLSGAAARFVFVVGAVDGLDNRVIAVRAERVLDGGDVAAIAVGRELDAVAKPTRDILHPFIR